MKKTGQDWKRSLEELLTEADGRNGLLERLTEFAHSVVDRLEVIEKESAQRLDDLDLLFEVSRALISLGKPDEVLKNVVEMVAQGIGVSRCTLMLKDERGEALLMKAAVGVPRDLSHVRVPIGHGIAGKVAETGEAILIEDIEEHDTFRRPNRGEEFRNRSLLCVPLIHKGKILGVINANNKVDGSVFNDRDRKVLQTLAGNAAVAIHNSHLHRETEEARAFIQNVIESMDLAILAVNPAQDITLVNTQFCRIFEVKARGILGGNCTNVLPPDLVLAVSEFLSGAWAEGQALPAEFTWTRKNGEEIPIEGRAMIVRDAMHNIIGAVLIFEDITESKELDKLRKLDEMKTNFVSTVAHELRTPLASMIASISLIRNGLAGETNPQQDKLLGILCRNADRLKVLVNDILDLSRLESGTMELQLEPVLLEQVVEDSRNAVNAAAEEKNIRLLAGPFPDGTLFMDPDKIQQVLINLLGNAIKFTPPGGTIKISSFRDSEKLTVCVEDTGVGIPPEQLERVFEKFHQVEDAMTRTNQGSGLGLSICRHILGMHGGTIWVESRLNEGSRFYFTIPLSLRPERRETTGQNGK